MGDGQVLPADVARAADVSNATLNYWLNGVNGMSAAKARLVANYLKIDALWLETGKGEPVLRDEKPVKTSKEARMILAYEEEETLLDLYRRSDDRGRQEIMGTALYEGGGHARIRDQV